MSTAGSDDEVPYYLMPVAAILGTYSLVATLRALYQIYQNVFSSKSEKPKAAALRGGQEEGIKPLVSRQFAVLIISILISTLGYGFVTAKVNNAIASSSAMFFDPYEILEIDMADAKNLTTVKAAYRKLSKIHHPDKTSGDSTTFQQIHLAYRSLSDEDSRRNWELYGHPDGPQTQTLSFALPEWLLHPKGNTAIVLVLLYLGMFVAIILSVLRWAAKTQREAVKSQADNSVAGEDMGYLTRNLSPTSTHIDVLLLLATTPENIQLGQNAVNKANDIRSKRMEYLAKLKKRNNSSSSLASSADAFDMDSGGWADDVDEEDDDETKQAAELARKAEEEKKRQQQQLAAATGKAQSAEYIKLEGIDDGVIGQSWVEKVLEQAKKWPPKLDDTVLAGMTFQIQNTGKVVKPMDHPAVRRNLCMTIGRLNAQMLNTHDDLLEAGKAGLADPTYFKSTMEYRQRTGLLLEAALRISMSMRSYRLAKTIIEAVCMFKIGTESVSSQKTLDWFREIMTKQYEPFGSNCLPELKFVTTTIETPDEDEVATEDVSALVLQVERLHAEAFTKQKVALCEKQGIPPQIAMQSYREGWWILIRAKRLGKLDDDEEEDGEEENNDNKEEEEEEETKNNKKDQEDSSPLQKLMDEEAKKRFEKEEVNENRLLCAWPFIVSNVAQKTGKVKVQFKAPSKSGKYTFYVDVKSQEFLGCDQAFTLNVNILDSAKVQRKEEKEEEEKGDDDGVTKGKDGEGEEEEEMTKDDDGDKNKEEKGETEEEDDGETKKTK